jgi:hypothetical protein
MLIHRPIRAALSVLLVTAPALAADGPIPVRSIAPDTAFVVVSADDFARTVEAWNATPLNAFLQSDAMRKVLGDDGGAQDAMDTRLGELGVPEGSFSWPKAFGAVLFTVHDEELDAEESHAMFYGDWGAGSDGMARVFEAFIAEAVKKEGVTIEKETLAGREVQVMRFPERKKDDRQGGGMDIQVNLALDRPVERLHYCRDGSRFIACTDMGGLEDALEAIDGKRVAKLPEQKDFRSAMEQLGEVDVSVAILTGPMQKSLTGEGAGMLALLTPVLQPLFGDVQAWTIGIDVDSPRGQVELSSGVLVPGEKAGLWSLLGPAAPIEAPPPMVGPDATALGRINVRLKDLMNMVNGVVANLPEEQAAEVDAMLINFGPVMTKALEALGPGIWTWETVRQPLTPESRVTGTVMTCTNPKAVVPMITQFGGTMGLEPRDVDGNTIFAADFVPFSVGVSNGWMAAGDSKMVEQSMRAVGQKDLPSVAESPVYKAATLAVGGEPVVSWGFLDTVARWSYERKMLEEFGADDSRLDNAVGRADDSSWAKRLGYKVPANTVDVLKTIDDAMVSRHVGPTVWSMKADDRGFVTRAWLMQPMAEPEPKAAEPAKATERK